MDPNKQRIAIAEACGWKKSQTNSAPVWWKDGQYSYQFDLPDYLTDLNAIHEAEKVLTIKQLDTYCATLDEICVGTVRTGRPPWSEYRYVCAPAAQRAEAFLKTINIWRNT